MEMKWWIILLIGWVKGQITEEEKNNIYVYLSKNQVKVHEDWFKEELVFSRMYKNKKELIGKLNNNQLLSEKGETEKDLNEWIKKLKYPPEDQDKLEIAIKETFLDTPIRWMNSKKKKKRISEEKLKNYK